MSATADDLRRAIELREALRRVLLANTGVEVDTAADFAVLDGAAARARIELCFAGRRASSVPAAAGTAQRSGGS